MPKKYIVLFFFSVLIFSIGETFAQTPKLPFRDVGACPFECCSYRQWRANKDTIIYKQMRDNSPIAFRIKKREKVTGLTGVVVTKKAGRVKALKDLTEKEYSRDFNEQEFSIKSGDVFYVLTSIGEGFYRLWYKGKFFQDQIDTEKNMKILTMPVADWWVKIKNRKGQSGWTKLPENFDNKDTCS
jgi:hypothetical protein